MGYVLAKCTLRLTERTRRKRRNGLVSRLRGITAIELAAVVAILIVITALSFNICILIFAADMCDRAARDCARAAGMMSTPQDAQNAMNASLLHHQTNAPGWVITQFTSQLVVFEDYIDHDPVLPMVGAATTTTSGSTGSNGGGGVPLPTPLGSGSPGPFVMVRTTLRARIPAPIFVPVIEFWRRN